MGLSFFSGPFAPFSLFSLHLFSSLNKFFLKIAPILTERGGESEKSRSFHVLTFELETVQFGQYRHCENRKSGDFGLVPLNLPYMVKCESAGTVQPAWHIQLQRRRQMALVSETEIFTESEWLEIVNELSLPPRQAEVIKQLLSGRSDKQIATVLQISVPTVRTYLSRLFSRFDVQDRTELVLYVFRYFRKNSGANGCHR